jgi:hypothetical protein
MSDAVMNVFRRALAVSGKGMLALFAFMLLFFILLVLVDKIFPGRESEP